MKHSCVVSCHWVDLLELCIPPVLDIVELTIFVLIGWY